jgi:aspartokinase-like uncharacterized kinase
LASAAAKRAARPWVVKLGGSLHDSPALRRWLKAIAASPAPVVIVPGGGPFADAVRLAQKRLKFSDTIAHHLALLAMEQYGRAMIGLTDSLTPADTVRSIRDCLKGAKTPVWLPAKMILGRPEIAESWDVTSDSLALWLAARLRARGLILVKSTRLPVMPQSAASLSRRGIIDAAFPCVMASLTVPCWCIEARHLRHALEAFDKGAVPRATCILQA